MSEATEAKEQQAEELAVSKVETPVSTPSPQQQGSSGAVATGGPPPYPRLFDLVAGIKVRSRGMGRIPKDAPNITAGMSPVPFRNQVGFFVIHPDELASLMVPLVQQDQAGFVGYQRALRIHHAFTIAWAWDDGAEMPNVQVSLDEYGNAFITEGQHRCVAAMILMEPLEVRIKQRTFKEAHDLFVNQFYAKKPDKNHMVKTGTDAMSRYVQDALVDSKNPWHDLIDDPGGKVKLSPSIVHGLITTYACDQVGSIRPENTAKVAAKFDRARADELAELIGVFGRNPTTGAFSRYNNPIAFQGSNLRSLAIAATYILVRAKDVHPGPDKERWMRHMTQFDWGRHVHLRGQKAMVEDGLLPHWNKKLTARRVTARNRGGGRRKASTTTP